MRNEANPEINLGFWWEKNNVWGIFEWEGKWEEEEEEEEKQRMWCGHALRKGKLLFLFYLFVGDSIALPLN